ncbi:DUF4070 domain-containing protein [Candidatus Poribacteria bacterium]|nr:DUF4070 domain-containing protein [Candidatus Poribacteria bacterium]
MNTNALLVYPKFPPSYWGYQYALKFIGKKANMPPLGLLTVAGMFPKDYTLRVVDMNVEPLTDAHLRWADIVFTSTMVVQRDSLNDVIQRAKRFGKTVVAGGPHPTSYHDEIKGVDHFVLDEVEEILPEFLQDLRNGTAKPMYRATRKPDVTQTPQPRYDLIKKHLYGSMALQFSRGCPFDCEFCDITKLFGRVPRVKSPEQMLKEFQLLHDQGWRGAVFVVDDNFIGNKRDAMAFLPHLAQWQKERSFPFSLYTEASVNLAEMDPLMDAMVDSGFNMVFLGIETPNPQVLLKTNKRQNTKKGEDDFLLNAVRTIQRKGMEVTAGFILGLDGDTEDAFDSQIDFITEAGIPTAMVGLLTALKGTNLYHRLLREDRLVGESVGNNVSISLNFRTEMDTDTLVEGYKRVLRTLYDPTLGNYFERCLTLLENLKPTPHVTREVAAPEILAFVRSLGRQLLSRQGPAYARFLATALKEHRALFPEAVRLAVAGYHYQKVTSQQIAVHEFREFLESELDAIKDAVSRLAHTHDRQVQELRTQVATILTRARREYERIHKDFRYSVQDALEAFQQAIQAQVALAAARS